MWGLSLFPACTVYVSSLFTLSAHTAMPKCLTVSTFLNNFF